MDKSQVAVFMTVDKGTGREVWSGAIMFYRKGLPEFVGIFDVESTTPRAAISEAIKKAKAARRAQKEIQ